MRAPDSSVTRLWLSVLAFIVWALVMNLSAKEFSTGCPAGQIETWSQVGSSCKSVSPIVALELVDKSEFTEILNQQNAATFGVRNAEVLRQNTWLDFLYIFLYFTVLVTLSSFGDGTLSIAGRCAALLAALFDVAENVSLLIAIHHVQNGESITVSASVYSQVKWILFVAACFIAGLVTWKAQRRGAKVVAILLVLAAIAAAAGLVDLRMFKAMAALFGAASVAILFVFFPFPRPTLSRFLAMLEFAYLIRFQLIAALLLSIALPVLYLAAPSIFVGLFDAIKLPSFVLIIWMSLQLAWTVMTTIRLVMVYGIERFSGIGELASDQGGKLGLAPEKVSIETLVSYGLLAAPVIVTLCCGTSIEWFQKLVGIALGVGIALLIQSAGGVINQRIELALDGNAARFFPTYMELKDLSDKNQSELFAEFDSVARMLPERIAGGYLKSAAVIKDGKTEVQEVLHSGHKVAIFSVILQVIIYILLGVLLAPRFAPPERQPAAMFFLLFLITLLTWALSGVAFFLDLFRIPVLTTVIVVSLVLGSYRTDHVFEIKQSTPGPHVSPEEVVEHWRCTRQKPSDAPIVIVATAGGGIRAAAWTAQVLTGLSDKTAGCTSDFASSVVLVSSVSGGSVGSMFFLSGFDSADGKFKRSDWVNFNASRSSLSSVGWGLSYPDLVRTLPMAGWAVPERIDRGWSLEKAWTSGWLMPPRLSEWRADVAAGRRPAAIFNATAAESGQRFLIASTELSESVFQDQRGELKDVNTVQFSKAFPFYDVPISTAARLSAAFPFVSPEPRPSDGDSRARVHLGDGGYYDTSGAMSALEWIEEASPALQGHPVLLLLIDAEPGTPRTGQPWSWQRQMTAPIATLLNVNSASQKLRDDWETELSLRHLEAKGIQIKKIQFLFTSALPSPLSWHLTLTQDRAIRDRWKLADSEVGEVTSFLNCSNANGY